MRPVLRLLGTRYGIALVLIVLVLAVVGIVRSVAGAYHVTTYGPAVGPSDSSSVGPTAGDDSVLNPASPSPPVTSPGGLGPTTVAVDFIHAWLNHTGVTADQWRASFARYATASLKDKLKNTDPEGVPAERTTGDVVLQNRAATYCEATIPVDSGTVVLRMVGNNGRWLVDGVDWERT
jgi:hypothetical protein